MMEEYTHKFLVILYRETIQDVLIKLVLESQTPDFANLIWYIIEEEKN